MGLFGRRAAARRAAVQGLRHGQGGDEAASGRLAVIAGAGGLPPRLARAEPGAFLVSFEGTLCELPEDSLTRFRFEKLGAFFDRLRDEGVTRVVMAGALSRPHFDMKQLDRKMLTLAPRLMSALRGEGDDGLLRMVVRIFEEEGFRVQGVHEILPDVVAAPGRLAGPALSREARADLARAQQILGTTAPLDIGQGCVVAGGLCLGIETLQGTDAMLRFVADTPEAKRRGRGVLLKAPKTGQDLRVDMPAIGPDTLRAAAAAGLEAVVIAAGGVLMIDAPDLPGLADSLGLGLHAVPS